MWKKSSWFNMYFTILLLVSKQSCHYCAHAGRIFKLKIYKINEWNTKKGTIHGKWYRDFTAFTITGTRQGQIPPLITEKIPILWQEEFLKESFTSLTHWNPPIKVKLPLVNKMFGFEFDFDIFIKMPRFSSKYIEYSS